MTRDDLKVFRALDIDFDSIGLEPNAGAVPYFCTPVGAEEVGSIGCSSSCRGMRRCTAWTRPWGR